MSNVVKNEVVKITVYDKLVAKANNLDTIDEFALKTKYDADKKELEKKIPDTTKLLKKSDYNAKISDLENKIPSISALVTTSALTAVENKIPSVSNLVKKLLVMAITFITGNLKDFLTKELILLLEVAIRLLHN